VVRVQPFDARGARNGTPIDVSPGTTPTQSPNPAIAALDADHYAVAWIDGSGGTPDVALRLVSGNASVGSPRYAHASRAGPQEDPDLLWIGSELLVAWTDLVTAKVRRFTSGLSPIADEQSLSSAGTIASNVALTLLDDGFAVAWRSGEGGFESIVVRIGSDEWRTDTAPPGPSGDHPALVELDGDHLLLVYSIGTAPSGGPATVGRLRAAVLARGTPGMVVSAPLGVLTESYSGDTSIDQRRPAAARVGERTFVGWQSESPSGTALGDEVWVQEFEWDPGGSDPIEAIDERALPIDPPRGGDQRNSTLAVSPLFPGGALITLWEDWSGLLPGRDAPDVLMGFRPVPFVTLDSPDASMLTN
jgi:hypothetical protein